MYVRACVREGEHSTEALSGSSSMLIFGMVADLTYSGQLNRAAIAGELKLFFLSLHR